jgi:hypothetical protein
LRRFDAAINVRFPPAQHVLQEVFIVDAITRARLSRVKPARLSALQT